jgi:hypothetical protein
MVKTRFSRLPLPRLGGVATARKALTLILGVFVVLLLSGTAARAGETDLAIPDLREGTFTSLGGISAWNLLFGGACVIAGTLGISLYQLAQIKKQPAHRSMLNVAETIFHLPDLQNLPHPAG